MTYFKRNNSEEGKVFYASCEEARSQWCMLEGEIEAAKTSLLKQGYQIPLDDIEAAVFFKNWLLSSASQSDLVARLNKRESGLPTMLINMRSWMDTKRKQWELNAMSTKKLKGTKAQAVGNLKGVSIHIIPFQNCQCDS